MISLEDLQRVANELGAEISEEELRQMIEEADNDGDGLVSEMEFLRIMKRTCLYWYINNNGAVTVWPQPTWSLTELLCKVQQNQERHSL